MRFIPVLLCLLLFRAHAAEPVATFTRYCAMCGMWGADTILSETGQFIVHAYSLPQFSQRMVRTNAAVLRVEPQLLAVTAERTKRIFLQELGQEDQFRGKVHVAILDRATFEQPIALVARKYSDGFQYQLGIPREVENIKLIKALTQTLILELANRNATRNCELPAWLVEGMTQQVLSSITPTYVANRRPVTIEIRGYDRLNQARAFFRTNSGLTMAQMSFADLNADKMEPNEVEKFQSSAHFMVHELLRLPRGKALMSGFIQTLPATLNWQTAFYRAYRPHFQRPLDLEKWWTLVWVDFQNRREHEQWPVALSLEKLESTLLTSIESRIESNSLPVRRELTLRELIDETDIGLQKEVLEEKLQQLFFLRFNLSPQVAPISGAYQQAIKSYLDQQMLAEYQPGLRRAPGARQQMITRNATKQLSELDQAVADMKGGKISSLPGELASRGRQARR